MTADFERRALVIGYGSTLRGDDAVGRRVAERIGDLRLPHVETISTTQLVPELAKRIAEAGVVVFVDASAERISGVEVQECSNELAGAYGSHTSAPEDLLALANACYGRAPAGWLVKVSAVEFDITEDVSAGARGAVRDAVRAVERICRFAIGR